MRTLGKSPSDAKRDAISIDNVCNERMWSVCRLDGAEQEDTRHQNGLRN